MYVAICIIYGTSIEARQRWLRCTGTGASAMVVYGGDGAQLWQSESTIMLQPEVIIRNLAVRHEEKTEVEGQCQNNASTGSFKPRRTLSRLFYEIREG